jgi:hypothetical protein
MVYFPRLFVIQFRRKYTIFVCHPIPPVSLWLQNQIYFCRLFKADGKTLTFVGPSRLTKEHLISVGFSYSHGRQKDKVLSCPHVPRPPRSKESSATGTSPAADPHPTQHQRPYPDAGTSHPTAPPRRTAAP